MRTQDIIVHPANEQELHVIKAFFKALKIRFEVFEEGPYNPGFVEKIVQGQKDLDQGKGTILSLEELRGLCK